MNLAKEKASGRLVAIKELHIPNVLKLNKKEAVIREGKILEKLRGKPFIIELYVRFREKGALYFVFENCKHGTLAKLMQIKVKFEPELAKCVAA